MWFDSVKNWQGDAAEADENTVADYVDLTISSNQHREVMNSFIRGINGYPHSTGFLVIADESHHFKNIKSDRAQAIARITEHCTRKMILTGTMMPKELLDIYTQFDFLTTEQAILPNIDRFKMLYRNDDPGSNRILSELLNPFFFRVSKSRLNLPPQTFNPPTVIEMYPIQRRIYDVVANVVKRLDQQYRKDLVALNQWRRRALVFLIEAATDPSLLPHRNQFGLAITDETDDLDTLLA